MKTNANQDEKRIHFTARCLHYQFGFRVLTGSLKFKASDALLQDGKKNIVGALKEDIVCSLTAIKQNMEASQDIDNWNSVYSLHLF